MDHDAARKEKNVSEGKKNTSERTYLLLRFCIARQWRSTGPRSFLARLSLYVKVNVEVIPRATIMLLFLISECHDSVVRTQDGMHQLGRGHLRALSTAAR